MGNCNVDILSYRLVSVGSTVEDAQALLTFIHTSEVRSTANDYSVSFALRSSL